MIYKITKLIDDNQYQFNKGFILKRKMFIKIEKIKISLLKDDQTNRSGRETIIEVAFPPNPVALIITLRIFLARLTISVL